MITLQSWFLKRFVLLTMVFFSVAIWHNVASQQVTVSFGNPIEGAVGDSVYIHVSISNITGLNVDGYNATIAIDPAVFEMRHILNSNGSVVYSDIIQGPMTRTGSHFFVSNITSANEIRVAAAGTVPLTGSGTLFTIRARLGIRPLYEGSIQLRVLDIGSGNLDVRPRPPYNLPVIIPSSIERPASIPNSIQIFPAYPNPFNPGTRVDFQMQEAGFVSVSVYDLTGIKVASLKNEHMSMGKHSVIFDASGKPSGVYLIRFSFNGITETVQRVTLVK
jgi:hypothetical protein